MLLPLPPDDRPPILPRRPGGIDDFRTSRCTRVGGGERRAPDDDDPQFAGADSMGLLASAVADVRAACWDPQNVDCTVVLEAPKLAPHRAEMQQRLSAVVGAPVTVKGKRAEGLGALGRREGVACLAVALLTRSDQEGVS